VTEQNAMRHVKREKTKVRRLSLHAAIFGAGDARTSTGGAGEGGAAASQSGWRATLRQNREASRDGMGVGEESVLPGGKAGARATLGGVAGGEHTPTAAGRVQMSVTGTRAELRPERRSLHQASPWIVHIAPCLIDVPTGGSHAKHELQFLSPTCRLCVQPESSRDSSASGMMVVGATGEQLDGAAFGLVSSPHELRPAIGTSLLKKMTTVRYLPGDTLIDSRTGTSVVHFVLAGQVRCDVDPAPLVEVNSAKVQEVLKNETGVLAPGEPFARDNDPFLFAPPAGAPLGEWLLLQPNLVQQPRVIAHTQVHAVTLTEDVMLGAMQNDEFLANNLWWARTQRETFCFLRKLEPFCWWQPSKLWRWLGYGRHVKVPEGKGQLGAHAPFVVLVQGKCHVSYNDSLTAGGVAGGMGGGEVSLTPQRESTGGRAKGQGGMQRDRLGSMKLLGSGARIADLLTFQSHHSKDIEPSGVSGGGKWVPGPDVVHCHEEIAYHFARDSLVFIPSEKSLPWLPSNYIFGPPLANGGGGGSTEGPSSPYGIRVATATGSPSYSFDKRSASPAGGPEEGSLAA